MHLFMCVCETLHNSDVCPNDVPMTEKLPCLFVFVHACLCVRACVCVCFSPNGTVPQWSLLQISKNIIKTFCGLCACLRVYVCACASVCVSVFACMHTHTSESRA